MKINQELLRRFKSGEIALEYDGVSLELLREITGWKISAAGNCKYYGSNYGAPLLRGEKEIIPIKDFLVEKWQPKWGEEVEVSDNGDKWFNAIFIGINPKTNQYVVSYDDETCIQEWREIRQPLKTITKAEAEKLLNVKIEG